MSVKKRSIGMPGTTRRSAKGSRMRAQEQMRQCLARPVVLPKGADPELGRLFGLEGEG